jgi:hypothetical protein
MQQHRLMLLRLQQLSAQRSKQSTEPVSLHCGSAGRLLLLLLLVYRLAAPELVVATVSGLLSSMQALLLLK